MAWRIETTLLAPHDRKYIMLRVSIALSDNLDPDTMITKLRILWMRMKKLNNAEKAKYHTIDCCDFDNFCSNESRNLHHNTILKINTAKPDITA